MAWRSPASYGEAIMGVSVWRQHPPRAPFRGRVASWRARNWRRAILAWFVLTLAIMAVAAEPAADFPKAQLSSVPAARVVLRTGAVITAAGVPGVGSALVIDVPLAGSGSDPVSDQALATLRNQILPATLGRVPGISYAVTGDTASEYDFTRQLHDRTPVVLAVVAGLAFVLLLIAFRSVGISLVSILLNLLSVGAAYGLITLIFQDGRFQHLLGYTSFGRIIA
jgi:putative drug exporter of the RND superfamily